MTQLDPLLSALSALAKRQGVDFTLRLEFSTTPCPTCRGKGVIRNACPEMCEQCEGTGTLPPLRKRTQASAGTGCHRCSN